MTKEMTLIVPAYNGLKWLEQNRDFWNEITKYANVILIEDSTKQEMKEFCQSCNITYFSKENGNWGSVLNFVKNNKIVKTEWMSILDVDDIIDFEEFGKLLIYLKKHNESDVIFTSTTSIDYISRTKELSHDRWIHSSWFKTQLLYNITDLPENVFYSDNFILARLESANYLQNLDISPYVYFKNIPGQSTDINSLEKLLAKVESIRKLSRIELWLQQNAISSTPKKVYFCRYFILKNIRCIYDSSTSKSEIKGLKALYKKEVKFLREFTRIPISRKLIWSRIYRFVTFKWMRTK